MKTYKSSDLTHKRAEVLKAAREEGVIIEERRSNGEVINEYTLRVRYKGLKCRDEQAILNTMSSDCSD